MKKNSKVLIFILALAIMLPVFRQEVIADKANPKVSRIAGENRVETAIKVSQQVYSKADTVVITGYNGEADALTGTILAADKEAPVLLTYKDKLDPNLAKELKRLDTKNIYILGGETVVNSSVITALEAENYIVIRLAGKTRIETAVKIAQEVFGTDQATEAFVVEYNSLVDALAIGPVAARNKIPIFMTYKDEVPTETKDIMTAMEIKKATIVGGENKVTPKGKSALEALGATVGRVAGTNRIKTSLEVANSYFKTPDAMVVASGYSFADALVGGYFATKMNSPILLTNYEKRDYDLLSHIRKTHVDTYVLGGVNVISQSIYTTIENIIKSPEDEIEVPEDGSDLPNRTIYYMESGEDVRKVQVALKKLGYNITADSSYGPSTRAAVLDFQMKYSKLENNGIYGPNTRAEMLEALKGNDNSDVKPGTNPPDVKPNDGKIQTRGLVFTVGKSSDQVRFLKDFFRAIGEKNVTEGYGYDARTVVLVRNYQKLRGLEQDGIAGKATMARINKEIKEKNLKVALVTPHIANKGDMVMINKTSNTIYFIRNGAILQSYPVATGKTSNLTPDGKYKIIVKFKNPYWGGAGLYPPIAGGAPNNPLGTRWLGISLRGGGVYGVHGNADPGSIGTYASLGCVRMFNPDVEKLYEQVKKDTTIWMGDEALLKSYGVVFK